MGALGGGGIMGLGQQLMSQGLGMGEITSLARETMRPCQAICRRR